MKQKGAFDKIVGFFRQQLESLPDKRTGKNSRYGMEDAALSAFSVFFSQSPSFLAYQSTMEQTNKDGEDALLVNWCELTVTRPDAKVVYKNSFATNHKITDQTVAEIVLGGRTRWKVENENNNTLKTKGYNLEHNFGHGKQHLASFLATLNILSLLFHTLLELVDDKYKLLREYLPTRKTFFDDLRALTRYLFFDSWEHLLTFMIQGLDLALPPNSS